jgi:hypothetical protein
LQFFKGLFKLIDLIHEDFGFILDDSGPLKIHLIDRFDDLIVLLFEFRNDSGKFFLNGPFFFNIHIEPIHVLHTDLDLLFKGLAICEVHDLRNGFFLQDHSFVAHFLGLGFIKVHHRN